MRKLLSVIFCLTMLLACDRTPEKEKPSGARTHILASGLSNQCIYDIEEDTCGQIWFATFRGLNRFDSRDFHQYFTDKEDSLSIPNNQIRDMIVDRKGRLWIGTAAGICRYTGNDNFVRHRHHGSGLVSQMVQGPDSVIYIAENFSLHALHVGPDSVETLLEGIGLPMTIMPKLIVDRKDRLWISGRVTLLLYDYDNRCVADSLPLPMYATNGFMVGEDIWFTGNPKTLVFDTNTHEFRDMPEPLKSHPVLSNAEFSNIHPYGDDSYLLQTASDGLYLYDRTKGEVIHQDEKGFPLEAPEFKISTIFTDSRKNIWFGGVDQGFFAHYWYMDRFNNDNRMRQIFSDKSVVSTTFDKNGNLWASTMSDGLYVYNLERGTIRNIDPQELSRKQPGKDLHVHFVFADSKGFIWLVMTNHEVLKCSYDSIAGMKVLSRYHPFWGPMEVAEDAMGTIWIGSASPFVAYLSEKDTDFKLLQIFDGYCFIPSIMQYDENSVLVAGFNQPLKTIDMRTKEVSLLPVAEPLDSVLPNSVFIPTDICKDRKGQLWIGTVSNGLLHYNPVSMKISVVEGAACADISAIEEDSTGNLWISTLYGLSHYSSDNGKFTNYFDFDGLGGNQFYDRSSASLSSKEMLFFGGTHGVTSFNPGKVTQHIEAPLMFQYLKVHNDIVRPGKDSPIACDLSLKPEVTLKNNQNSFAIGFVAVDYCDNPRVTYRYKLEGVDQSWRETSQNHEATYANVDAGKYIFRVRLAGDSNGSGEILLRITVLPSIWLSWWAIMIYILIGISISGVCVYFFMKIRTERRARMRATLEKEQERKINDMNMRFFANVSHEFRTPLTMISGPIKQLGDSTEISENDRQLLSIAQTNVNRMLKLVNQLLDFNRLENDTLRLEVAETDVAALLNDVTMSFALAARYKQIDFRTLGLEQSFTVSVDADKIIKIYYNLLSNALKFTPSGGKIKVSFDIMDTPEGRRMILKVENTGRSIPEDKLEKIFQRYYQLEDNGARTESAVAGSGIGLYYARALATMHHGTLKASQPDFEGVCFTLELPAQDVYSAEEHQSDVSQMDSFPIEDNVYPESDGESGDELDTILVVDDDIQVANYIRVLLSPVYKVVTMFDAESALQWLSENRPALIISDVVMPGMDGYEFCRHIKADLELCHIPVLLVTAKASVENQVEGFDAEANAYITKPFDPALLMSLIGSLLRNRDRIWHLSTTSTSVEGVEPDIMAPQDSAFLSELYQLMENELSNSELDVNNISRLMRMSRTKFYYKVKGLTGQTPAVFFRTYKLNRAAELIKEHRYTISEISDLTGFSSLSHFSRSFKKQFGTNPTSFEV